MNEQSAEPKDEIHKRAGKSDHAVTQIADRGMGDERGDQEDESPDYLHHDPKSEPEIRGVECRIDAKGHRHELVPELMQDDCRSGDIRRESKRLPVKAVFVMDKRLIVRLSA